MLDEQGQLRAGRRAKLRRGGLLLLLGLELALAGTACGGMISAAASALPYGVEPSWTLAVLAPGLWTAALMAGLVCLGSEFFRLYRAKPGPLPSLAPALTFHILLLSLGTWTLSLTVGAILHGIGELGSTTILQLANMA